MEVDISDILDSVHSQPPHPDASATSTLASLSWTALADHMALTRCWTSERSTPHLLPYPTQLLERIQLRLRAQVERVEELAAGIPSKTTMTTAATTTIGNANANLNLTLAILQTDLSRTQFLLRSLLRARLAKLTAYASHYLSLLQSSSSPGADLASPAEAAFLTHHQALLTRFYDDAVLGSLPVSLRGLQDTAGGVRMVEGPDPEGTGTVFVRCLVDEWESSGDSSLRGGSGQRMSFRRGEVWVVRWADAEEGVLSGDLELL